MTRAKHKRGLSRLNVGAAILLFVVGALGASNVVLASPHAAPGQSTR
jgi:hypothetical protein